MRFLTASQVAEALNVSRRQAYRLLEEGRIPGVYRFGGCLRVSREGLEKYIQDSRVKPNIARSRAASALYEARKEARRAAWQ